MNAAGIALLSFLMTVVLFGTARWALLAILAAVLFLTQGQQVEVAGIHVYALRFLEVAAFVRVLARGEFSQIHVTRLDRLVVVLYAYTTLVFMARSSEGHIYQIGLAIDAFLVYFAIRGLLKNVEDLRWTLAAFVFLLVPYSALVLVESVTGQNPFSSTYGSESAAGVVGMGWSRADRLRSIGSFRHPSLLGILGASFFPLYVGALLLKWHRGINALGVFLCLFLVWASNSGAPLSCAAFAVLGWILWTVRTRMQLVRRGIAFMLIALVVVMKAPIWYLLSRLGSASGGDAYHRAKLMDQAFQHIHLWGLAGMRVQDTAGWFPYILAITGGADIANNYLVFAVTAGLGSMALFIALIVSAFSALGKAMAVVRANAEPAHELLYWALGVVLLVHVAAWFGTSYFDQSYVVWFFHLAAIATVTDACLRVTQSADEGHSQPVAAALARPFTAPRPIYAPSPHRSSSWVMRPAKLTRHRKSRGAGTGI